MNASSSQIAVEVDRLVIGVHRAVMCRHKSELGEMTTAIGVALPGHLYDLAEFLGGGVCTGDLASRRFRYEPGDAAATLMADLHNRRLLDDQLRPCGALNEAVDTILGWRAEVAESMWHNRLAAAQRGAAVALSYASGSLVDTFRSLPEPISAAHRLHHLLTGLRYARMEAHFGAWEQAGLTATEIVALSSAVKHVEPVSPAPENLVAGGLLTALGSATATGHTVRSRIEADTNDRCSAGFDAIDPELDWFATICALKPEAR